MNADDIAAIVERFPLPEGVPDAVLNKRDLSEFFGCSLPTIDSWIMAGMPALSEGTNGRSWEFQASVAWAWKCNRDENDRTKSEQASAAIAAMRLALIGGRSGDSMRALPPKDRQQLYDVEAAYEKLKRERNQSLDRDETSQVFSDVYRIVRDTLGALPDTLERELMLDGKGVTKTIEACDALLEAIDARIKRFFSDRPEIKRDIRTDLFN